MILKEPKVFLIAETTMDADSLDKALEEIGGQAPEPPIETLTFALSQCRAGYVYEQMYPIGQGP